MLRSSPKADEKLAVTYFEVDVTFAICRELCPSSWRSKPWRCGVGRRELLVHAKISSPHVSSLGLNFLASFFTHWKEGVMLSFIQSL